MKIVNPAHAAALAAYPVGSIYMSVNAADPETLFGGTWERIQGRFLFAADDARPAGNTGGEETHTLTTAEMPAHAHTFNINAGSPAQKGEVDAGTFVDYAWWEETRPVGETGYTGNNQPHNNMPPYLSVYCWKRTA